MDTLLTLTPIDINAGASLDVDVSFVGEDGAPLPVTDAHITFAVHPRKANTLLASDVVLWQRRNEAAGGAAGEVVQPVPSGGSDTARVKIIPSNTGTRGIYRYRVTAAWPSASPPVARIREGQFRVL